MPRFATIVACVCSIALSGCAASDEKPGAEGVGGPVEACLNAQRQYRQWCSETMAHGRQTNQYRCLDARLQVDARCMPARRP